MVVLRVSCAASHVFLVSFHVPLVFFHVFLASFHVRLRSIPRDNGLFPQDIKPKTTVSDLFSRDDQLITGVSG